MIELSHTVADPRAMMVHPNYAFSADRTMVNSSLLHHIAFKTVTSFVEGLDLEVIHHTLLFVFASLLFIL